MARISDIKTKHFHKILDTIREINRILVLEKDEKRISYLICKTLVKTRGYFSSWVILLDSTQKIRAIEYYGESTFAEQFKNGLLGEEIPEPYKKAIVQNELTILADVKSNYLPPLANKHNYLSFVVPIQTDNQIFGLLCASIPEKDARHPKEKVTLTDIANNIALVLSKQQKQADWELLFENSADGFIVLDNNLNIINVNSEFCRIVDMYKNELIGINGMELSNKLFSVEKQQTLQNLANSLLTTKQADSFELSHNNRTYSISTKFKPLNKYHLASIRDITKSKTEQKLLEESEVKYRNLINSLSDSLFILQDGIIKYVNPSLCTTFNTPEEELLGQDFTSFIAPSEKKRISEMYKKRLTREDVPIRYTSYAKLKLGKQLPVEVSVIPIEYNNKPAFQVTLRDISAYKEALKALSLNQNKLNNLLGNLQGMAYTCKNNPTWDMLFMSRGCYDLLGYHPSELTSDSSITYKDLIHPDDRDYVQKTIQEAVNHDQSFELEYRITTKLGQQKWVWEGGKQIDSDDKLRLEGFISDITRRKELESKNIIFSKAIETSTVSIVITDINGDIEYVNPYFEEKTGYNLKEILAKKPSILKSEYQSQEFYKKLWDTILSGKTWSGELYNKKKNGEYYWEQANISPIFGDNRKIEHFIAVKEDVTKMKNTLQELEKARDKAEESDRLKSAFLANMSHEIRTPMNGILGFTELLQDPTLTGEQQQKFVAIIRKSGDRMLNTINDIINISKIESGLISTKNEKLNLHHFLNNLYLFFHPQINNKGLQLFIDENDNKPLELLYSDSDKLNSILTNLLRNAIKFTETGHITFGYKLKGNNIEFYVRDTGIGIPQDRQQIIFERFVQVDVANSRMFEGSGLGLAITKSYTEMLGGTVSLKSEIKKGSTFYINLPVTVANEVNVEKVSHITKTKDKDSSNKLKILIAEDDKTSVELLKILLKKYASEIIIAENGLDTVNTVKENPDIELIMMDIKMPQMDGLTATVKIREFNTDVKIIAQSAFAQPEESAKAFEMGCDDFITKPVNKTKLLQCLNNLFE